MEEKKETKYVELPPVRLQCYFCGKEHEYTSMNDARAVTPGHGAGFAMRAPCECGAFIELMIHISKPT